MIKVTRLNDSTLMINVDRIQSLQAIPETVITFTNNDKIMVKEPLEEVSQRIVDYQRTIYSNSTRENRPPADLSEGKVGLV
ncbi:MAG: flagellar FlbD family protein [Deltaproteobacteria bacterium]|jgi:flagellar protein FlbD